MHRLNQYNDQYLQIGQILLSTYLPTYLTSFQTGQTQWMFKYFFKEQESTNKYSLVLQWHAAHPSSKKASIGSFYSNTYILFMIFAIQIIESESRTILI